MRKYVFFFLPVGLDCNDVNDTPLSEIQIATKFTTHSQTFISTAHSNIGY